MPLRARRAAALPLVLEHQPGQRGEVVPVALGQLEQQTWLGLGFGLAFGLGLGLGGFGFGFGLRLGQGLRLGLGLG